MTESTSIPQMIILCISLRVTVRCSIDCIPIVYKMSEIVEDIGGAIVRYGAELWLMEDTVQSLWGSLYGRLLDWI